MRLLSPKSNVVELLTCKTSAEEAIKGETNNIDKANKVDIKLFIYLIEFFHANYSITIGYLFDSIASSGGQGKPTIWALLFPGGTIG